MTEKSIAQSVEDPQRVAPVLQPDRASPVDSDGPDKSRNATADAMEPDPQSDDEDLTESNVSIDRALTDYGVVISAFDRDLVE